MGISLPGGGYVSTIRHFARIRDTELLTDLLSSDLHPEIFDDSQLQGRLLESSAASGDWRTYTLLMAARLASIDQAKRSSANSLLIFYLMQKDFRGVLRVLDDMQATGTALDVTHCAVIFRHLERLSWHPRSDLPPQDLAFYFTLCRRLSSMDVPVPVLSWKKLVYLLGRLGHIDELLDLAMELIIYYTSRQSARPGFMPIHLNDVPSPLARPLKDVENLIGVYIPLDTPPHNPQHPLNQIFDEKCQRDILRWSFRKLGTAPRHIPLIGPSENHTYSTHFARSIRVLRELHDRGLRFGLQGAQKAIQLRLAELYGDYPAHKAAHQAARNMNVLSLGQMKKLCDDAWGGELLPPLEQIRSRIRVQEGRLWQQARSAQNKAREYAQHYPRSNSPRWRSQE
ncbi:hypothetical protein BX600DRAFT_472642 [Xylariales sp. PMI_506]|nr:hypothetical protein BX600DRAFT_472642 [Xylariales sp. PMI_506]